MERDQLRAMADGMLAKVQDPEVGDSWDRLSEIWKWLKDQLLIPGVCEHKEWLTEMADEAIDLAIAFDIPWVPNMIEPLLDQVLAGWARARVKAMISKVCP